MILRLRRFLARRTCATAGHLWVEVERYEASECYIALRPGCTLYHFPDGNCGGVFQDCTGKVACVRCKAVAVIDYTRPVAD